MKQGSLLEVTITDLNTSGEGVGRINGKVIFVPDTVTGDRALVRLTRVKSKYAEGKLQKLLTSSSDRIRPRCIVADKCGGCQWQHLNWEHQLTTKRQQVIQSLQRIGGLQEIQVQSTLHTADDLHYRNKVTYPLGISSTYLDLTLVNLTKARSPGTVSGTKITLPLILATPSPPVFKSVIVTSSKIPCFINKLIGN